MSTTRPQFYTRELSQDRLKPQPLFPSPTAKAPPPEDPVEALRLEMHAGFAHLSEEIASLKKEVAVKKLILTALGSGGGSIGLLELVKLFTG